MDDATIKDKILQQLVDIKNNSASNHVLAEIIGVPSTTVYALAKEMAIQHHVETIDTATFESYYSLIVALRPEGRHFFINGGYSSLDRKRKNSNVWKIMQMR